MCVVEGLFAVEASASVSEPVKADHSLCTQVMGVKFCKSVSERGLREN